MFDIVKRDKLAVTVWNYKGGVGKSTISLILSEIGAEKGLKVLAVDLDEQRNLTETLKLSASLFPSIEIRTELKNSYADEDYDLFLIDTHPSMNEKVEKALKFADIVLVPVLGDYHSLVNLSAVFDYISEIGVGREQAAIVKNVMSSLKMNHEVEEVLSEQGYLTAGRLPRCNALLRNIASGYKWDKYLREKQRLHFMRLYENLWIAYRKMAGGSFTDLWNNRLCD